MVRDAVSLGAALVWRFACLTSAMDVHTVAPVQTDSYCARGYPICSYTLTCLHDYRMERKNVSCNATQKTCEDFGSSFRKSEWNGMCDHWENVERRYECSQCVGFVSPETVAPSTSFHRCYHSANRCPNSYNGSCCFTRLDCPDGFVLSDSVGICGQTECGIEHYAASEVNYMGKNCHGIFPGDRVLCQTCVKKQVETTASTTTASSVEMTALTTTVPVLHTLVVTTSTGPETWPTSDYSAPAYNGEECDGPCSYPLTCPSGYRLECQAVPCEQEKLCTALGDLYQVRSWSNCGPDDLHRYECCRCARSIPSSADWELVGSVDHGACRGRTPEDNSPSYYTVYGVDELGECKDLCLQHFPSCKGIEHSHGRCELWNRTDGVAFSVDVNITGFTCMRFGWASKYLVPVDGGSDRACRGATSTDNDPSYYWTRDVETLEACQAMCTAAPLCFGIEFSPGRCEIWIRAVEASAPREGFSCFAYHPAAIPFFTEKDTEDILLP